MPEEEGDRGLQNQEPWRKVLGSWYPGQSRGCCLLGLGCRALSGGISWNKDTAGWAGP